MSFPTYQPFRTYEWIGPVFHRLIKDDMEQS